MCARTRERRRSSTSACKRPFPCRRGALLLRTTCCSPPRTLHTAPEDNREYLFALQDLRCNWTVPLGYTSSCLDQPAFQCPNRDQARTEEAWLHGNAKYYPFCPTGRRTEAQTSCVTHRTSWSGLVYTAKWMSALRHLVYQQPEVVNQKGLS